MLQQLYLAHAAASATDEEAVIVYRNALPPPDWLNQRLAATGESWRVGACEGLHCTFTDSQRLPLTGMISARTRQAPADDAVTA